MSGHGHVIPNPDGTKARCGGPSLCLSCALELAQINGNLAESRQRQREKLVNDLMDTESALGRERLRAEQAERERDSALARLSESEQQVGRLAEAIRAEIEWLDSESSAMGCDAGNPDAGDARDCFHCQLRRAADELRAALNETGQAEPTRSMLLEAEHEAARAVIASIDRLVEGLGQMDIPDAKRSVDENERLYEAWREAVEAVDGQGG